MKIYRPRTRKQLKVLINHNTLFHQLNNNKERFTSNEIKDVKATDQSSYVELCPNNAYFNQPEVARRMEPWQSQTIPKKEDLNRFLATGSKIMTKLMLQ